MLGWIFSAFGPITSPKADYFDAEQLDKLKREFLQPMLALYARWCDTIFKNGASDGQKGARPAMTEIAVRAVSRTMLYYALGASVAGFPHGDDNIVRGLRKGAMMRANLLDLTDKDFPTNTIVGFPDARVRDVAPDELLKLIGGPAVEIQANNKKYPVWDPNMKRGKLQKTLAEQQRKLADDSKPLKKEQDFAELQKLLGQDREAIKATQKLLAEIDKWEGAAKDSERLKALKVEMPVPERKKLLEQQKSNLDDHTRAGAGLTDKNAKAANQALIKQDQEAIQKTQNGLKEIERLEVSAKQPQVPFTGWRDVYYFANRWLYMEALAAVVSFKGAGFGNCAETYPLLMLCNNAYK